MKAEKVILLFFAVLGGLIVAGVAYLMYQSTRPQTTAPSTITLGAPTPTPSENILLVIDQPIDETVVTTRSVTVSGTTLPDTTLILSTPSDDQVAVPTREGKFSLTASLLEGQNILTLTAILPDGRETTRQFTVTSSNEEF